LSPQHAAEPWSVRRGESLSGGCLAPLVTDHDIHEKAFVVLRSNFVFFWHNLVLRVPVQPNQTNSTAKTAKCLLSIQRLCHRLRCRGTAQRAATSWSGWRGKAPSRSSFFACKPDSLSRATRTMRLAVGRHCRRASQALRHATGFQGFSLRSLRSSRLGVVILWLRLCGAVYFLVLDLFIA
jgi:hypothetical protein